MKPALILSMLNGGAGDPPHPELFVPGTTVEGSTLPAVSTEVPNGQVNLVSDGSATARRDVQIAVVNGATYKVKFTLAGGNATVRAGNAVGNMTSLADSPATVGANEFIMVATGTSLWFRWFVTSALARTITNISIKLV